MAKEKIKPKNKEKSIFNKKSQAGKGDVPRRTITGEEWSARWDKIFGVQTKSIAEHYSKKVVKKRSKDSWRENIKFKEK